MYLQIMFYPTIGVYPLLPITRSLTTPPFSAGTAKREKQLNLFSNYIEVISRYADLLNKLAAFIEDAASVGVSCTALGGSGGNGKNSEGFCACGMALLCNEAPDTDFGTSTVVLSFFCSVVTVNCSLESGG